MQADSNHVWEIAVPNGPYSVLLGAGDPRTANTLYRLSVEDVLLLDGVSSSSNRWVEGLGTVIVTDGRLTIRNAPDSVNNKLAFVEISAVEPATIEQWRAVHFATTNYAGAATDDADPDSDGLPNLLEYAFGLNPTQADPAGQLVPTLVHKDGAAWFACEFLRNTNATDLTFTVEASNDVAAPEWFQLAAYTSGTGWSGPGKVVEAPASLHRTKVTVFDLQPIGAGASRFVRLQVAPP